MGEKQSLIGPIVVIELGIIIGVLILLFLEIQEEDHGKKHKKLKMATE